MYKDWTIGELQDAKRKLLKANKRYTSADKDVPKANITKMAQLNFAIRAKRTHGKFVNEAHVIDEPDIRYGDSPEKRIARLLKPEQHSKLTRYFGQHNMELVPLPSNHNLTRSLYDVLVAKIVDADNPNKLLGTIGWDVRNKGEPVPWIRFYQGFGKQIDALHKISVQDFLDKYAFAANDSAM